MTVLVAFETGLLVVLLVLVAGLLRSHAELLRRLGPETPEPRSPTELDAAPLEGTTPDGDPVVLSFTDGVPILLAFLSTGCAACGAFWDELGRPLPLAGVRPVIVTHGPQRERPHRLRELAPDGVPVILSERAWGDYRVPGSPYFVLVDGAIRGEGVAPTWDALVSLLSDARDPDSILAANGIGPGHASLRG